MKILRPQTEPFFLGLFLLGLVLSLLALMPYLGLGTGEQNVLYQWFGFDRAGSLLLGLNVMVIAAFGLRDSGIRYGIAVASALADHANRLMDATRFITARPAAVAVMAIFGAWVSLRYSLGAWAPDADIAVPIVLWSSLSTHGLSAIEYWNYTPDNYLLSLIWPVSVIYTLFGTRPTIVIGVGWLIFIACVGMTFYLVYRIAGRRAGLIVGVLLMFPNKWAIADAGFLSYPITHNISMAWALLALVLALRAIERGSILSAAAAGLCVFIDVVSDPWAGVAIALPLIFVGVPLAWINRGNRQGRYVQAVCIVAATGFLAALTKLYGVLDFLSPGHFTITNASGLVYNFGWMFRFVAIMFNILPHANLDSACQTVLCLSKPASLFDFGALAAILMGATALTITSLRRAPIAEQLVSGVAIVSIAGVAIAFLLTEWGRTAGGIYMGRFFPNLYFFGALLAGTAFARNWERLHVAARAALAIYGLLFIVSGLVSGPGLWTGQTPMRTADDVTKLGAFLEQNGLTYGYGPYWGSNALAMNWLTGGRVTIRPVAFYTGPDRVSGYRTNTSSLWYAPGDEPAGTAETFLVINNDVENCPSVDACVATATRQFGAPSRRLTYGDSPFGNTVVLVWSHPIVSQIVDY